MGSSFISSVGIEAVYIYTGQVLGVVEGLTKCIGMVDGGITSLFNVHGGETVLVLIKTVLKSDKMHKPKNAGKNFIRNPKVAKNTKFLKSILLRFFKVFLSYNSLPLTSTTNLSRP